MATSLLQGEGDLRAREQRAKWALGCNAVAHKRQRKERMSRRPYVYRMHSSSHPMYVVLVPFPSALAALLPRIPCMICLWLFCYIGSRYFSCAGEVHYPWTKVLVCHFCIGAASTEVFVLLKWLCLVVVLAPAGSCSALAGLRSFREGRGGSARPPEASPSLRESPRRSHHAQRDEECRQKKVGGPDSDVLARARASASRRFLAHHRVRTTMTPSTHL